MPKTDGSLDPSRSLERFYRATVASPPWFALPVAIDERPEALTVTFAVPARTHGGVRVKARRKSMLVVGRDAAIRACSLPEDALTSHLEAERSGDLLRVRIPRRGPKPASMPSALLESLGG
jgi:HSP20 family molecular chaperone IbpA